MFHNFETIFTTIKQFHVIYLKVWMVLFGSTITFIGIASIFYVMAEQKNNNNRSSQKSFKQTFFDQLQHVLSLFTLQGILMIIKFNINSNIKIFIIYQFIFIIKGSSLNRYHPSNRLSVRILIGSWLLAMVVLVYAYRGVLMSILFVPKLKPIVENWEQLAAQNELKLTSDLNSTLTQLFMV